MFAASKTDSVSGAGPDAQFNQVTMLLHGDGTNGAQNNTFLDSSTNNFTITRNGNTTQGSFSPYGSNWSNYFDGTGDYLSIADNAALDMGSSSFTIEGWFLPTANVGAGKGIFGKRANNGVVGGLLFYFSSTGLTPRLLADIGGSWGVDITASSGFTLGQWNHFATVRNSNTWTIYINGTSVGSATNSGTVADNSAAFTIMAESAAASEGTTVGYISNFRVVKGSAVYTSAFTPSTTPLTAITNTSLLTCQSNRFVDNSANNFTITRNGDTSVQRFNPFGTSTAYSTSVIGGSGYFDGSGDTLTTSTSQIIPTGSFTVECWAYVTSTGNNQKFVAQGTSATSGRFSLGIEGGNWWVQNGSDAIQTGTPVRNQWNYVAVTYNGSTINLYINGTSIATVSSTANAQNTTLTIGQDWNSYITTGYISDVRISNTVRTISVPTAPYSSDGSTRLLLNMTNGAIFDNAMMNDLETVGNAQISTSVKKYGTGSLYFDGTGDWLIMPYGPTQNFGTGNFTIEGWFYLNSLAASYYVPAGTWGSGTSDEWLIQIQNNGSIRFLTTSGSTFYSASITTATWYHIAVVRSGTTVTIYVNGTSVGSYTCSNSLGSVSKTLYIGSQAGTWDWNGYIDDFRITNGYARYTATFTPPTSALSDTGPY